MSTTEAMHDANEARPGIPPAPGGNATVRTPGEAARRSLSASELHERRVAWGKLWGARISEATRQWKGE